MNEKEQNEELEIDLTQLFKLLRKNIKLIIACTFVCAVIMFAYTFFLVDKKYASTATIFISPKVTEQGTIDSGSVNTNSKMVNNYMVLLKGENILSKVADQLNIENAAEIKKGLTVSNSTNTEVISVTSTTNDAQTSQAIVQATVETFFNDMKDNLKIENLTIIDAAKVNSTPVSPNLKMNALIGALVGIVLSCGYVFLRYLLDNRLRNREAAENYLGISVLVEIPYFEESK